MPTGFAALFSLALLWFVSKNGILTAAFAGGLAVLAVLASLLARRQPLEHVPEAVGPDWSVTVAAIDRPDAAVVITDRAGRLVCANALYEEWFQTDEPPAKLPLDEPSAEQLAKVMRAAWRDGQAEADLLENEHGRWSALVKRSGRGEDFLIWRFTRVVSKDLAADTVRMLGGKIGRALSRAGFAAAIVTPEGIIQHTSAGFALRAAGDPQADLAGKDFVSLLRQDNSDRFTWAREGRSGAPLTLFHLPIADPDNPAEPDPKTTLSLMLLADAGAGIGGGSEKSTAAVPHLEALLSQLPLGLAMADRDGRLLFANAAFMRAALQEGQAPPIYPTDLVVREDKGPLSDAIRRFGQGPATSGDIAIRLPGQPDDPVTLSLAGVRGLGEPAVLLGLTDTTEETRLKRQVAQATKMQAVGQLAGGVAHDFNNVLTAILGTCDLMLMRHTPGDSDYDDIQQVRANSNRAASLTRQLLAFSRQQTLRPEVLQLPDVVSDVSQMLKRLIGQRIQLIVQHDRDLGPVRADPTQLEQVIVNLVVNARDAMLAKDSKGTGEVSKLLLQTKRVTMADVRAMRSEVLPQAEYTALVIEDTGGGIPPEHLGKIWEPFFTTKETGKGTGLGLSTVYGIVKQSGGFIFAESEVGKGTRFTVYLPVYFAAPDATPRLAEQVVAAPRKEWSGGGRVLLVEDEDPVRIVAERALTRAGYTVIAAHDGEEGLEIVEGGAEFDVIVSDVVMPVVDGPAMVREIRKTHPDLPVLFMSGYAEEQLRRQIDIADVHFLPKPFSVQQLTDRLGEILAAGK